jgi:hypothetical protein
VDLPQCPDAYKQGSLAIRESLNMLRQETSLEWSVLSPSADLYAGQPPAHSDLGQCRGDGEMVGRMPVTLDFVLSNTISLLTF